MKQHLLFYSSLIACVLLGACSNQRCNERCCMNYYENQYGSCTECQPGTFGVNCTGTCVPFYYGRLCRSKCDCPLHQCDLKLGCRKNKGWVATPTLAGIVIIVVLIGLPILTKFWLYKKSLRKKQIIEPNENQTENIDEERRYEGLSSSSFPDEAGNIQQRGQVNENNYTDMRLSVVSLVYDDPNCEPDQNSYAMQAKSKQSLTARN
nr:uncharacterized protein LOC117680685 [Crassostrea gigas]